MKFVANSPISLLQSTLICASKSPLLITLVASLSFFIGLVILSDIKIPANIANANPKNIIRIVIQILLIIGASASETGISTTIAQSGSPKGTYVITAFLPKIPFDLSLFISSSWLFSPFANFEIKLIFKRFSPFITRLTS